MRKFWLVAFSVCSLGANAAAFTPHSISKHAARQTMNRCDCPRSFARQPKPYNSKLLLRSTSDDDRRPLNSSSSPIAPSSSWIRNPIHAIAWPVLLVVAFALAPGELGSASDSALLQQIIDNPANPGINPLFYTIFNMFGVVPFLLAALILPQEAAQKEEIVASSAKSTIPATPFLIASAAFGFFAMGPYLALFFPNVDQKRPFSFQNLGWFTKNVTENKFVAYGLVLFTVLLPIAAGLPEALATQSFEVLWKDFVELESSSRFCFVSSVDLSFLYLTIVSLTVSDYRLRATTISETDENNYAKVALLSALLPFLGSALYLAWRPALPGCNEEES